MDAITPETIIAAYARGIFPMADSRDAEEVSWYAPRHRGILPLDRFHVSKSLRKFLKKEPFRITFDADFAGVIRACAESREDTWINATIEDVFNKLHKLGLAHSAEAWDGGRLAGGVYGLHLGGAFFGESMFSIKSGASKAALVHLAAKLHRQGFTLFDAQFVNDHIAQFGCTEIPQKDYLQRLKAALEKDARFYSAGTSSGAPSGASSEEKVSDFALVESFLHSITQTS